MPTLKFKVGMFLCPVCFQRPSACYSPEKWLYNRIYCPSNRSKQIKEIHTAYTAGTQYTRQSLNEKQHTWLHKQTVIGCKAMYVVLHSNFAAYIVCRRYSPEKLCHNRICCPSNRSKQVQETHTAYIADTQYTRQSLNEKQHTWLHRQCHEWHVAEKVNQSTMVEVITKDKHTTHIVASIHWIAPQAHC